MNGWEWTKTTSLYVKRVDFILNLQRLIYYSKYLGRKGLMWANQSTILYNGIHSCWFQSHKLYYLIHSQTILFGMGGGITIYCLVTLKTKRKNFIKYAYMYKHFFYVLYWFYRRRKWIRYENIPFKNAEIILFSAKLKTHQLEKLEERAYIWNRRLSVGR